LTPLQSANHGAGDLMVYAYGTPPEDAHAELLEPAVVAVVSPPAP
jgi:hypothetical protein